MKWSVVKWCVFVPVCPWIYSKRQINKLMLLIFFVFHVRQQPSSAGRSRIAAHISSWGCPSVRSRKRMSLLGQRKEPRWRRWCCAECIYMYTCVYIIIRPQDGHHHLHHNNAFEFNFSENSIYFQVITAQQEVGRAKWKCLCYNK